MSAFVSVVVPCYNGAEYLEECLRSVLDQTHRDLELVYVDNCSDDGSLEIALRLASEDERLRVFENERFLSQVENHNAAVAQASPDAAWVKVLQADDFLMPDCLERMVGVGESSPSVGLVGAYTILGPATVYLDGLPYGRSVFPGREVGRAFFLSGHYVTGSPTATLVRGEVARARRPFYDDVSPVEDVDVCFEILREWDFGFVHQVLTYTRRENDSLISGFKTFGPMLATKVVGLRKYGLDFLDPAEYQHCLSAAEGAYYRFMGERVARGAPKGFFAFHDRVAKATGVPLSRARVAWATLRAVLDVVGNPVSTLERVFARLRGRS